MERTAVEAIALSILTPNGIAAIWELEKAAADAHRMGRITVAVTMLEIADAAERLWLAASLSGESSAGRASMSTGASRLPTPVILRDHGGDPLTPTRQQIGAAVFSWLLMVGDAVPQALLESVIEMLWEFQEMDPKVRPPRTSPSSQPQDDGAERRRHGGGLRSPVPLGHPPAPAPLRPPTLLKEVTDAHRALLRASAHRTANQNTEGPTAIDRPRSPFMFAPWYRFQITSALSILHRLTGIALTVGLIVLAWWLIAVAAGGEIFAATHAFIASPIGVLLLLVWSVAFFYHLCNGIRHLAWDAGDRFEIRTVYLSAYSGLGATVVLTVLTWLYAFLA